MDLQELKKIAPALDADLKAVFAKHGLTWAGRNASLNPGNGELSYKIKLATTAGGTDDIVRGDFKCFAFMFELKPEWLDATVKMNHENYRVAGLYPKKHKYPVLMERVSDKKRTLFRAEDVALRMNAGTK